jgi:hypothetical protein
MEAVMVNNIVLSSVERQAFARSLAELIRSDTTTLRADSESDLPRALGLHLVMLQHLVVNTMGEELPPEYAFLQVLPTGTTEENRRSHAFLMEIIEAELKAGRLVAERKPETSDGYTIAPTR